MFEDRIAIGLVGCILPEPKVSSKATHPGDTPACNITQAGEREIAGISVLEIFHIKIARLSGTVRFFAVQMFRVILIAVDAEIWNCYGPSTWPLNQERRLLCLA
jgi:hypothetical protein